MTAPLVEKYYTPQQLGYLLEFSDKTIRTWAREGKFGVVVNLNGKDMRIPASGVQAFLANNRIAPLDTAPVAARSVGELRRKIAAKEGCPDV